MNRSKDNISKVILRTGLVVLFLWFGISQITNVSDWVAWVPPWALGFGLSDIQIVLANGWFETIGGTLLILGLWTRIAAFVLSIHLFSLAFTIGINDIGVRDFALATSTLALALFGPDTYTLDTWRKM